MSRLRIVCKQTFPNCAPYFPDTDITLIDDEGRETAVTNVSKVSWSVDASPEPARAVLEFVDVDIETETSLREVFDVVEAANALVKGEEGAHERLVAATAALGGRRS